MNKSKIKTTNSLRFKIGLFYSLLALLNIIFFTVMIFENQSDLLLKNFQFQSENLANTILADIQTIGLSKERDENFEVFRKTLKLYEINAFTIFDTNGKTVLSEPESGPDVKVITESVLKKTKEVSSDKEGNLFKARYSLDLNESDFTVDFLLPIRLSNNEEVFLYTHFNISSIQDRLKQLYIQVGYAVLWGVVFHIIFAILVYRAIFKRVGSLEVASKDMALGNLKSRVDWDFKSNDELDSLGKSFNLMADEIQNKVTTITRLNEEINQELQIGKEVQELFLPSVKKYKKFNIGKLYRPMREVSGDLYQYFQFPDKDYYGFFLADASGHGVSAALVTVVMAMSLQSIMKENHSAIQAINQLGEVIANRLQASFFATGVFVVFEEPGVVKFVNAGHNAPFIVRPSTKEITYVDSSGPPLGMGDDIQYSLESFPVLPGDKIVLYTDGVVETPIKEGGLFGLERFTEVVLNNVHLSNAEIVEKAMALLEEKHEEYKDDVTMIVLDVPE
ncbi:SpoIIE family protein phosphatase [Leptospira bandrabouensis]|uniref:PP2C family protein-serine/threonine phosphatase n=1 Tax=Leptospira bandrabouensis TaxID=2484903 RepID=UPI00223C9938|nr:SpoIIE family protein phosphatase [Leptospira bandrabouensis]MCW7459437.1 SpoIIE family protein phosphatase [Leptospira bandrabouensis]MCW7477896.1 SpoIIE family protein phosphatase [Leptospira bandrabouensis]MCW7485982.1 SpoIIE family protein phosphatase [Leptospira bandrabouensis]